LNLDIFGHTLTGVLLNSDLEAASWPVELEEASDPFPNYDIYEENQAQT